MQVIYQLFSNVNEFRKRNYIEFLGHLGMFAIRSCQLYSQSMMLKRKWEIEREIKNVFIGDLHERWQFPSDHLPVGVEVDGIEVVSWNVLNNEYIEWVYKDSQGINGSMITDLDVVIKENGFTKRDDLIVTMIGRMIEKSKRRGVIALQECSNSFLEELENSLPSDWGIVRSGNENQKDQNVILYDREKLFYSEKNSMISLDAYPSQKGKAVMNVSFERKGKRSFRIFNTHIPGDPNLPGRYEFAEYIKRHNREEEISIALGDMNFERDEMVDALRKKDLFGYLIHSPNHTNIDPYTRESKCIDHMIVFGDVESTKINSENIGIDLLKPIVDVLLGK
jgi:endonuclease/exonuclease/phosphatase family metal-dependent hydrolase